MTENVLGPLASGWMWQLMTYNLLLLQVLSSPFYTGKNLGHLRQPWHRWHRWRRQRKLYVFNINTFFTFREPPVCGSVRAKTSVAFDWVMGFLMQ